MTGPGTEAPVRAMVVHVAGVESAEVTAVMEADGDVAVVAKPTTADDAIRLVAELRPDVVVIDAHLCPGGGQYTIEQVMARTPTPILVLSAGVDGRHSPAAVEALVAGALEALPLPSRWTPELGAELRNVVRQIRTVRVIRHPRGLSRTTGRPDHDRRQQAVVAVAASTGGPSALAVLLSGLGGLAAPVLVVQHLHPQFLDGLLEWMSRVSALPVAASEHGGIPQPGHIYLARGGLHLRLGKDFRLELDEHPVTTHRPSADELFTSVAERAGPASVGVVLTGMGDDGARGLLAIRRQGGRTLAQDEESSAVFGMPKAAARLGAVSQQLPLDQLAGAVHRAVREVGR